MPRSSFWYISILSRVRRVSVGVLSDVLHLQDPCAGLAHRLWARRIVWIRTGRGFVGPAAGDGRFRGAAHLQRVRDTADRRRGHALTGTRVARHERTVKR